MSSIKDMRISLGHGTIRTVTYQDCEMSCVGTTFDHCTFINCTWVDCKFMTFKNCTGEPTDKSLNAKR